MKYILAVALIALVVADPRCTGPANPNFKKFDTFHANCALAETFDMSCEAIFEGVVAKADEWKQGGPSKGLHEVVKCLDNKYAWITRTTPTKHYVDDILFEFEAVSETQCRVSGKSRSQSLSYYDYMTNFCNMRNLYENLNVKHTGRQVSDCKFQPKDAAEELEYCSKY